MFGRSFHMGSHRILIDGGVGGLGPMILQLSKSSPKWYFKGKQGPVTDFDNPETQSK